MSIQECALYGDLVLWLRDRAAELLAEADPDSTVEAETARLDELIHERFFTSQDELYGSAPREIIWREQLGERNPIPKEYVDDAIGDDDCPLCQMMREEIESAESDHDHGYFWTYCPDWCLLDLYDPEGSDERWEKELADFEEWEAPEDEPRAGAAHRAALPPADAGRSPVAGGRPGSPGGERGGTPGPGRGLAVPERGAGLAERARAQRSIDVLGHGERD